MLYLQWTKRTGKTNTPPAKSIFFCKRIPANKIGMKTVRVKQGMWKYWDVLGEEEQADFEVDDLSAVIALFESPDVRM